MDHHGGPACRVLLRSQRRSASALLSPLGITINGGLESSARPTLEHPLSRIYLWFERLRADSLLHHVGQYKYLSPSIRSPCATTLLTIANLSLRRGGVPAAGPFRASAEMISHHLRQRRLPARFPETLAFASPSRLLSSASSGRIAGR